MLAAVFMATVLLGVIFDEPPLLAAFASSSVLFDRAESTLRGHPALDSSYLDTF